MKGVHLTYLTYLTYLTLREALQTSPWQGQYEDVNRWWTNAAVSVPIRPRFGHRGRRGLWAVTGHQGEDPLPSRNRG